MSKQVLTVEEIADRWADFEELGLLSDFEPAVRQLESLIISRCQPKWISVDERLPERGELVLCAFCGIVSYGKLNGQVWVVNDEPEETLVKTDIISFVSHWMPLPEAPKKEITNGK